MGLCNSVAAARGSVGPLDRQRKPRTQITLITTKSHLAAAGVGVVCCRSGSGFATTSTLGRRRRRQRFLRSARASRGTCRRRGATSSIGRQGRLMPMTPARRSGLLRTAARPWRAMGTGRGTVNGRVVQAPAPALVHPGRVVRIIGLVSHHRAKPPNLVAAVGGSPAPQLG